MMAIMMSRKLFILTVSITTLSLLTREITGFVIPRSDCFIVGTRSGGVRTTAATGRWLSNSNDNSGTRSGERKKSKARGGDVTTGTASRGVGTKNEKRRNNNSNRNNNRQKVGYSYRNDGIKMKRKRPPRWEVEGDSLFFLQDDYVNSSRGNDDNDEDADGGEKIFDEMYKVAVNENSNRQPNENKGGDSNPVDDNAVLREVLRLTFKEGGDSNEKDKEVGNELKTGDGRIKSKVEQVEGEEQKKNQVKAPPPFLSNTMWGTMSVGPILKSKLEAMYDINSEPTPIQQEAFKVLTKKNNKNGNNVVIASPTGSGKTLAYALPLLATSSKKKDERKILILTPTLDLSFQIQRVVDELWGEGGVYVMQAASHSPSSSPSTGISNQQIIEWNVEGMLLSKAPIIASTPRILMEVALMCSRSSNKRHNSVFSNIKTVVLDEADRLLQTELVARHNHDIKSAKNHKNSFKSSKIMKNDCTTIQLLTLLEQKMGLSFDVQQQQEQQQQQQPQQQQQQGSRVQLICASATVGRTLRRQIMEITNASSIEKGSTLITADERTGKNAIKRKSSLLPHAIKHLYAITSTTSSVDTDNEDDVENNLADSIAQSMGLLEAGPSIIFPGRTGVQKIVDDLKGPHGLEGVRSLRDNDYNHNKEGGDKSSWANVPIVVVGEKFGRGLDIPDVHYVFISSPPSSPAAYAHLAGRTGRAGKRGIAVTFVRDLKEAKRLFTLAKKLGLQFGAIEDLNKGGGDENEVTEEVDQDLTNEYVAQDDEDLNNLNINSLKDMLRERKLKVSGRKSELISRLKDDMVKKTG